MRNKHQLAAFLAGRLRIEDRKDEIHIALGEYESLQDAEEQQGEPQ